MKEDKSFSNAFPSEVVQCNLSRTLHKIVVKIKIHAAIQENLTKSCEFFEDVSHLLRAGKQKINQSFMCRLEL